MTVVINVLINPAPVEHFTAFGKNNPLNPECHQQSRRLTNIDVKVSTADAHT